MIEQPDARLRSNETEVPDDEMVCDNCARYPDMPQRHSKDEMWDALKDGGECVPCMKARIEGLRADIRVLEAAHLILAVPLHSRARGSTKDLQGRAEGSEGAS